MPSIATHPAYDRRSSVHLHVSMASSKRAGSAVVSVVRHVSGKMRKEEKDLYNLHMTSYEVMANGCQFNHKTQTLLIKEQCQNRPGYKTDHDSLEESIRKDLQR